MTVLQILPSFQSLIILQISAEISGWRDPFLERKATLGAFFVLFTTATFQPFLELDGFALELRSKESTESHTQGNSAHKF